MQHGRPIDPIAIAVMLVLCSSWAFQQVAIKFALPDIGPLGQGTIRCGGAALLVGVYLLLRAGKRPWMRGVNGPGLLAGLLFGTEFILLFLSLQYTDASRCVIFLYTAPFVVALGGHLFVAGERLDAKATVGIVLAFAGVAAVLQPAVAMGRTTLAGDLLALAAGIGWGMTTLVIRATRLRSAPASQVLWYQLGVSAVMFFAAGTWAGDTPFVSMSGISIASVLYQMIWVTTITYGIWFVLIGRYSATNLSVITFVTPVMGVLMGHLILDEALAGNLLLAVTAVAGGILLVSLPRRSR